MMHTQTDIDYLKAAFNLKNQTEIGSLLGVSRETITDWHRGHQPIPMRARNHMRALIRLKELEEENAKLKTAMRRAMRRAKR